MIHRRAQLHLRMILLTAALSLGVVHADERRLGILPGGAISTSETSGVRAEICRDHLFDPSSIHLSLPNGYRLRLADEIAASDVSVSTFLRLNSAARSYAFGSLCFMSVLSFIVDGTPINTSIPMPAAFWWVAAEGPPHADMRGKVRWVQIGSWYPENSKHTEQILRTDPMARFTKIDVAQVSAERWHLSLVLPSETVLADIHLTSASAPRGSDGPGFMSVPMSGDSADYFSVYTYAGHHVRDAEGDWRTSGEGTFTSALKIPNESSAFGTIFQEGWVARAGLYRFTPRQ